MWRLISYPFVLAVVLLAAVCAAGTARAAEIILYAGINFTGEPVSLTQSTPDLGDFDNLANSVKVISGNWILYHNADYGVTESLPSKTLPPGQYPDLGDVGFPRNAELGNGLSSVQLIVKERPTTPPGGFRACRPPYRIALGQRCIWTCGPNSSPDEARNRCSCNSGYVGRGTDSRGRVRCLASTGTVPPTETQQYVVAGTQALDEARRAGFQSIAIGNNTLSTCEILVDQVIADWHISDGIRAATCRVEYFLEATLSPGWRMVDAEIQAPNLLRDTSGMPPLIFQFSADSFWQDAASRLVSITLEGPVGRVWQDAFAR